MSGYYFFIGAFALLGLYCMVYGAVSLHRLDRSSTDYAQLRAKELKNIAGGVICGGYFKRAKLTVGCFECYGADIQRVVR